MEDTKTDNLLYGRRSFIR